MISSNCWDSIFQVGTHHLARQLVRKGWKVGFVSTPLTPFHFLKRDSFDRARRWKNVKRRGEWFLDGQLFSYVPFAWLASASLPFFRSEKLRRNWHRLAPVNPMERLKEEGFDQVDLLYFDNGQQNFWLDEVKHRHSVFRVADDPRHYSNFIHAAVATERELANRVKTLVYVTSGLRSYAHDLAPDRECRLVLNGVDYEHFASRNKSLPRPKDFPHGPVVLYFGKVDSFYIDFDLVKDVASRHPNVNFLWIGPTGTLPRSLPENMIFLGPRPFDELPKSLAHAQAGLVPFLPTPMAPLVPLKLFAYLASGLPVLCRRGEAVEALSPPVEFFDTAQDLSQALTQILEKSSSEQDRQARKNFAVQRDWSRVLKELMGDDELFRAAASQIPESANMRS